MRFYNNKQAEMLQRVSHFLNKEEENLTKKVPALKKFISDFVKKEKELYDIRTGNPHAVRVNTLEKGMIRDAFIKATAKLIAVLKASDFRQKDKPLPEMLYTLSDLKRLPADKLCKAHLNAFNAAKKIKNLPYYGLSAGDMHDMQEYYNEFAGVKNAPVKKKKEVATKNAYLNKGVKEGIAYLEKHIDPLLLIAAEGDSPLYSRYKGMRIVFPRSKGRPSDAEAAYRKSREKKKE